MFSKFLFVGMLSALSLLNSCPASPQARAFQKTPTFEQDTCNDDEANPYCCFRDMPADAAAVMNIADASEPGQRMIIRGRIFRRDGKTPYGGVKVYAYHTNQSGIYPKKGNETGVHRWHGYLHGWCRTDADGRYEIRSIRPAQYPSRNIPAHVHAYVWEPDGKKPYYISDFVFADDKLVTEKYLRSTRGIPGGTGVVALKTSSDGTAEGVRDIVLQSDNDPASETTLTASTPGDALLKSMLAIPGEAKIDFIRWDLILKEHDNAVKTFVLNINYGIGQPNTLGFIGGGQKQTLAGTYAISNGFQGNPAAEVYHFKCNNPAAAFSLLKLNDNLFHLLTLENKLMVGNGGWSYSLNRKQALKNAGAALPSLKNAEWFLRDTSLQVRYDGRTPCSELAKQYDIDVRAECFKLKWGMFLYRDSKTLLPTTYKMIRVHRNATETTGKWSIVKNDPANPGAVIIRLDPDKPRKSLSFLVGDDGVLFFLDKQDRLLTGNENFSFALNRIKPGNQ